MSPREMIPHVAKHVDAFDSCLGNVQTAVQMLTHPDLSTEAVEALCQITARVAGMKSHMDALAALAEAGEKRNGRQRRELGRLNAKIDLRTQIVSDEMTRERVLHRQTSEALTECQDRMTKLVEEMRTKESQLRQLCEIKEKTQGEALQSMRVANTRAVAAETELLLAKAESPGPATERIISKLAAAEAEIAHLRLVHQEKDLTFFLMGHMVHLVAAIARRITNGDAKNYVTVSTEILGRAIELRAQVCDGMTPAEKIGQLQAEIVGLRADLSQLAAFPESPDAIAIAKLANADPTDYTSRLVEALRAADAAETRLKLFEFAPELAESEVDHLTAHMLNAVDDDGTLGGWIMSSEDRQTKVEGGQALFRRMTIAVCRALRDKRQAAFEYATSPAATEEIADRIGADWLDLNNDTECVTLVRNAARKAVVAVSQRYQKHRSERL